MAFWTRKADPVETRETSRFWLVIGNEFRSLSEPDEWLREIFGLAAQGSVPTGNSAALQYSASSACIRLISTLVSECPVHAYRRADDGSRLRERKHPVEMLLNSFANPWTDSATFIREMTLEALFCGHAVARVIKVRGEARELHQLKNVRIECDDRMGEPVYLHTPKSGNEIRLGWEDVLHLKSPTNGSPTKMATQAIELGLLLERAAIMLFKNGGMPAGILTFTQRMDSTAAKEAKKAWDDQRKETGGAGINVLGNDAKFTPITFTSVDAQMLELRRNQVLETSRFYGVSPTLLAELADASLNNSEALGRQFLSYTLGPWLTAWAGAATRCLIPADDRESLYAEHETAALTAADFKSTAESLKLLVAGPILTPDDARQRLNMSTVDGGDRLYPVQGAAPANGNAGAA